LKPPISLVVALLALAVLFSGTTVTAQDKPASLQDMSRYLEALSERVSPAVVQIFISRYSPTLGAEAGGIELYARQRGTGSGVVVDPSGYIVTNAHVVLGAERIRVLLPVPGKVLETTSSILKPKGQTVPAKLVGLDSETDVAVLKVEQTGLPHLEFGDSEALTAGQLVFAYGSPLGLETSVTMGVVSGVARQLAPDHPMIYIQTDASINPGNSGGPLVNTEGKVVGINTLILSQGGGNEGLGFAAPSNIVSSIYNQIRANGRVQRGQIGATVQTITPRMAKALGLSQTSGVIVGDVIPGSAADAAGMKVGDVILSMDGKPMENGRQFTVNLYQRTPGQMVSLRVVRNQANKTLRVEVSERTGDPTRFAGMVTIEENLVPRLGILVLDIDNDLKRMMPALRLEGGVLVAARAAGTSPWQNSLQPGDIIYALNRSPVTNLVGLKQLVANVPTGESVILQIERSRGLQYLPVELD
jgi:serine protease Do